VNSNLHKKAYFLSRRGLQELDIIFKPFVEERFETLSDKDKLSFLDLLQKDDVDLIDWLLNGMPVPKDLNNIVTQIKHYLNHEEK
jgi:antitoxin CptB